MKNKILLAAVFIGISLQGCSTTTVNSAGADYQMSPQEQAALGKGVVQFFSTGLPNYAYNATVLVSQDLEKTAEQVAKSIDKHGNVGSREVVGDATQISGRVGSGSMNMNPAGILVTLSKDGARTKIFVRAVAKEGVVKQNTSGKAVERLISDVETASGSKVERL